MIENEWVDEEGRVFGEDLLEEVTFKLIQKEKEGDCWEGAGKDGIRGPREVNMAKFGIFKEEKSWNLVKEVERFREVVVGPVRWSL